MTFTRVATPWTTTNAAAAAPKTAPAQTKPVAAPVTVDLDDCDAFIFY